MYDLVLIEGKESEFNEVATNLGLELLFLGKDLVLVKDKDIQKTKQKNNFILCNPENVRDVIENQKPNVIFGLEEKEKKDSFHHRNSGLNQVLCTLMNKNNIAYLFYPTNDRVVLGRMKQNIKFCRKYKVKMIISTLAKKPFDLRAPKDLQSLFITLGMEPDEAKMAMSNAFEIIEQNKFKKSEKFIEDGVEII